MSSTSAKTADKSGNNPNRLEDALASEPPPEVDGDVEHRIRDIEDVVSELAADVAGAEFIAATELAEDIGIEMEFQARLRTISSQQWQYWLEDLQATATEIQAARTPLNIIGLGIRHITRRTQHQQEGWLEFLQSLYIEQKKRIDTHNQLMQPLFEAFTKDNAAKDPDTNDSSTRDSATRDSATKD